MVVLRAGSAELRLAPAQGGRVTACMLEDGEGRAHPVLQPWPEDRHDPDAWAKGGMYPLVPYGGRIRDAMLQHAGHCWRLQPHASGPHTLHGIAQRRAWEVIAVDSASARLRYIHRPDAHWPWAFEAELALRLEPARLVARIGLCNTGDAAMPGGIGLHPYLPLDDSASLAYRASPPWPFDQDYLARRWDAPVDALSWHRWTPQQLSAGEVTRFHHRWEGPLEAGRLRLQAGGALSQLVIHRPAASSHVCVEPVSHLADGFNLHARGQPHTGTRILESGQRLEGSLDISVLSRSWRPTPR